MATTLDRFKDDLKRLIETGNKLDIAMINEIDKDKFMKQAVKQLGSKAKAETFINALPSFKRAYEAWYSECLPLLRQVLPDRLDNFIALYERPKNRKELPGYSDYVISDYMHNLRVSRGVDVVADASSAVPKFRQQLAILNAATTRFDSSLFEIRQIVQADLFDSEIEAAKELLKSKFLRAAGAIAGVVLEKHLYQVCVDHAIAITKKHPTIGDLNELLKNNSVIEVPQWRHISMLADIRNLCDHYKAKEPSVEQVTDLIDGASKILKTVA
jgi:hypothetical protein